jgi:hypothetical protein
MIIAPNVGLRHAGPVDEWALIIVPAASAGGRRSQAILA